MTILQHFAENGMTWLIPAGCNVRTGLYKGEIDEYRRDPFRNDAYVSDIWDHDDEYDDDEAELDEESGTWLHTRPANLQELKEMFELEEVSDEEFLSMSPAKALGITPSQLKFINIDALYVSDFSIFVSLLKDGEIKKKIPDVQRRIKYATVMSILGDYKLPHLPVDHFSFSERRFLKEIGFLMEDFDTKENEEKADEYIKNIIFTHREETSSELIELLSDYWRMYGYGIAMNHIRKTEGQADVTYPLFPKASLIRECHDKTVRDQIQIDAMMDSAANEEKNKKIAEICETDPLYKLQLYKDALFSILPVNSYDDLVMEGKILDHCVATYAAAMIRGETRIYFLRKNTNPDDPYFTVEVKEVSRDHFGITQCYTVHDTTDKSPECRAFIKKWAKVKKLQIRCEI